MAKAPSRLARLTYRLVAGMVAVGRAIHTIRRDLLLWAGMALSTYGIWQAWPPGGYIWAGLVLIYLGVLHGRFTR